MSTTTTSIPASPPVSGRLRRLLASPDPAVRRDLRTVTARSACVGAGGPPGGHNERRAAGRPR